VTRVLALVLSVVAAACMFAAIVGMVNGRVGARAGWALRFVAVIAFGGAVALGTVGSR
jgi:hypothetical protein